MDPISTLNHRYKELLSYEPSFLYKLNVCCYDISNLTYYTLQYGYGLLWYAFLYIIFVTGNPNLEYLEVISNYGTPILFIALFFLLLFDYIVNKEYSKLYISKEHTVDTFQQIFSEVPHYFGNNVINIFFIFVHICHLILHIVTIIYVMRWLLVDCVLSCIPELKDKIIYFHLYQNVTTRAIFILGSFMGNLVFVFFNTTIKKGPSSFKGGGTLA